MRNSINYTGFLDLVSESNDELVSGDKEQAPIHSESQSVASAKEASRQQSCRDAGEQ